MAGAIACCIPCQEGFSLKLAACVLRQELTTVLVVLAMLMLGCKEAVSSASAAVLDASVNGSTVRLAQPG
jgi:hypothetical protein